MQNLTLNEIQLLQKLNTSSTADIYLCCEINNIDQKYAVKMYKNKNSQEFQNEVTTFHQIANQSDSIVKYVSIDTNSQQIIMHLQSKGSMQDFIEKNHFPLPLARFYFKQLVQAIEFLHHKNITSRDIKPENTLLDENFNLKICDFGLATNLTDQSNQKYRVGTAPYMCPQLFRQKNSYCFEKADVFALGVYLFVMVVGSFPFEDVYDKETRSYTQFYSYFAQKSEQAFWRIVESQFQKSYDEQFKDLINKMLCLKEDMRISLREIQQHPFFTDDQVSTENEKIEFMNSLLQQNKFKENKQQNENAK